MPLYNRLITNFAQAATGGGNPVGNARSLEFGTSVIPSTTGVNLNQYPMYARIRGYLRDTVTTGGGTCTIQCQDCDDNATWVTEWTTTLLIPAGFSLAAIGGNGTTTGFGQGRDFKTNRRFVRLNVSAISGGTAPKFYGWLVLGEYN